MAWACGGTPPLGALGGGGVWGTPPLGTLGGGGVWVRNPPLGTLGGGACGAPPGHPYNVPFTNSALTPPFSHTTEFFFRSGCTKT